MVLAFLIFFSSVDLERDRDREIEKNNPHALNKLIWKLIFYLIFCYIMIEKLQKKKWEKRNETSNYLLIYFSNI